MSLFVDYGLLALMTKTLSIGITYTICGGIGVALTAVIGLIAFFKKTLDTSTILGTLLIDNCVIVMTVFLNQRH